MDRPNGSGQFIGGWCCLVIAAGFMIASLAVGHSEYEAGMSLDQMALKWGLMSLSGSAAAIGFLLFVTGWIIHAISFLPAKNDHNSWPQSQPATAATAEIDFQNIEISGSDLEEEVETEALGTETSDQNLIIASAIVGLIIISVIILLIFNNL